MKKHVGNSVLKSFTEINIAKPMHYKIITWLLAKQQLIKMYYDSL